MIIPLIFLTFIHSLGIGRVDTEADDFILHETQKPYAVKVNGWVLFKAAFWGQKGVSKVDFWPNLYSKIL